MSLNDFLDMIGFTRQKSSSKEKAISTLGGFLGIFGIFMVSSWLLDPEVAVYIVPSMGASAVLLFAAPHVPFSQPWNVFGGHMLSAVVGVACWQWIPDYTIAASASVGLAIGVMYLTRCIHPPGGATALAAVIGSEKLHNLGYSYAVEPILVNTVTILIIAVAFNALFEWRRYPANLPFLKKAAEAGSIEAGSNKAGSNKVGQNKVVPSEAGLNKSMPEVYAPINHEDFVYAISHIDTYVDISEEDILKIYSLATRRHVEIKNS